MWRLRINLITILCVVIGINGWKINGESCGACKNNEYSRSKRAKYYSSPYYKFYNRPTYTSIRSPNPFGPPNSYNNDFRPPPSSRLTSYKVSNRPIFDGLGDEGLNSLMKYLSEKDLDTIFEIEKDKYDDKNAYPSHFENLSPVDFKSNDNNLQFQNIYYEENKYPGGPNMELQYNKYNNIEYQTPSNSHTDYPTNYVHGQTPASSLFSEIPINSEDPEPTEQRPSLDEYFQREYNDIHTNNKYVFTDSTNMQEEELPKPLNLRETDYEISFTNNVPSVAKPDSSYKLGNFADLPLMNYENSKLETVNSYSVPHYTVISPSNPRPPPASSLPMRASFQMPPSSAPSSFSSSILSLIKAPKVEPAPPASVVKDQSDAHLKAIKVWTHKSKGTAYTLHDDGTLSLENPLRPQYKYS